MAFVVLSLLISAIHAAVTDKVFDAGEIAQILNIHNAERQALATSTNEPTGNLPNLVWDATLATQALAESRQCFHGHTSQQPGNSAASSGNGENKSFFTYTPSDMYTYMKDWIDEKIDWSFPNECNPGAVCGHYTQMIWEKTLKVGCAAAFGCNTPYTDSDGKLWNLKTHFTCRYSPAGNGAGSPFECVDNCPTTTPPPVGAGCYDVSGFQGNAFVEGRYIQVSGTNYYKKAGQNGYPDVFLYKDGGRWKIHKTLGSSSAYAFCSSTEAAMPDDCNSDWRGPDAGWTFADGRGTVTSCAAALEVQEESEESSNKVLWIVLALSIVVLVLGAVLLFAVYRVRNRGKASFEHDTKEEVEQKADLEESVQDNAENEMVTTTA